jgi:hypothetical protein
MTIEEGIRSILTSGVATGDGSNGAEVPTMDDIKEATDIETLQTTVLSEDRPAADRRTEDDRRAEDDSRRD